MTTILTCILSLISLAGATIFAGVPRPVDPLANEFVTVFESPDPNGIYCYTPGLCRLQSGRLVATLDLGGPKASMTLGRVDGPYGKKYLLRGKIFTSDDHGETWVHRGDFPFAHARPFVAGRSLYILGQSGDLMVIRSDDEGVTWSEASALTRNERWHQSACNVWYAHNCVYLVMEKRLDRGIQGWEVANLAPVLMRAKIDEDLTRKETWTFATELVFEDVVDYRSLDYFGVPFLEMDPRMSVEAAPGRGMSPIGWLETNVVQILDPLHYWYDPDQHTFHLFMRAHTGGTGYAAMCKVVEQQDGSMQTMLERAPSGKRILYLPLPGGQMRFHILYDEETELYWLLSSQATDSMTRADRLSPDRYNLPNNERHRLQLHFSRNCVDWCFAGIVTLAPNPGQGRHYASMVIDKGDLHILSRSGDRRARSAHDGNLITFHTIQDFRSLVY